MKASPNLIVISAPATPALGGLFSRLRAAMAAPVEQLRRRRRERATRAALERLSERELRDIGLVRFVDVAPVRYIRTSDWG